MCALEFVAWLAGEQHNDSPECASPVLTAVVRSFNDVIPNDAARSYYLRSLIPRLINTRASKWVEGRRVALLVDFMLRELLPMLLRSQDRWFEAGELAGLRQIRTHTGIQLAGLAAEQECGNREVARAAKMAASGADPAMWAPVASKLIEEIGTPAAFKAGVTLITSLIKVECVVNRLDSGQKTVPPIG